MMILIMLLCTQIFSAAIIHPNNPLITVEGALFISADTNRMILDRYSQEVLDSAKLGTVYRINPAVSATQAGMALHFKTASPHITLKFEVRSNGYYYASSYYYDIYCDGVFNSHIAGALAFSLPAVASGSHQWEILLPYLYSVNFKGLELDSGYALENDSIPNRPVYVAIGNSITHGMGQSYSNTTYPVRLARKKNWQLYNLAVGGSKIAEAVSMLVRDRTVDVFTIMWGYNDFNQKILSTYDTTRSIHGRLSSLIADLRIHHPLSAIYVITASYTTTGMNETTGLLIEDYRNATRHVIDSMQRAGDTLLFRLEGDKYSNASSLSDHVHFSPSGAIRFADSLAKYVVEPWNRPLCDTTQPTAPVIFRSVAQVAWQVELSWHSIQPDTPEDTLFYHVYRDGVPLLFTSDTILIDEGVNFAEVSSYRYSVYAIRQDFTGQCRVEGLMSNEVLVTAPPPDSVPLRIEQVYGVNGTKVSIRFNKAVDSMSAVNSGNYSIAGLTVSSAALSKNRNCVILTVTPMVSNASYQLIAGNIQDRSLPTHTLPLETAVDFSYSDLNNHLLGYWPLDEETGGMVYDFSGETNDGVCQGSYSRIPGKIDSGLHFMPNGHVLMQNNLRSLRFPFTLAIWINREDDSARALLCTEDVSGQYFGTWMGINGSGQVSVNFGNGGTPGPSSRKTKASNSIVPKNVWTHVAAGVNSATDMTLYVNGVDGEGSYSGTATSMAHSVLGKMQIGYQTSAVTPILHYQGGVDDIRVYDTALTQEQISRLASDPSVVTAGKMSVQGTFSLDATPNPFNPTVVIHFSLPIAQKVVLEIFDVKGGLVARLLDGQKDAGKHKLVWAGTQQASGVYLLRLQAGTNVLERKLVYLK